MLQLILLILSGYPNHLTWDGPSPQGATSFGSATALVAALDPSEAKLGVANLGDSGLRPVGSRDVVMANQGGREDGSKGKRGEV